MVTYGKVKKYTFKLGKKVVAVATGSNRKEALNNLLRRADPELKALLKPKKGK